MYEMLTLKSKPDIITHKPKLMYIDMICASRIYMFQSCQAESHLPTLQFLLIMIEPKRTKIFGLYSHEDLTIDITMDDELSYLKWAIELLNNSLIVSRGTENKAKVFDMNILIRRSDLSKTETKILNKNYNKLLEIMNQWRGTCTIKNHKERVPHSY
ncbi:hypothetical protein FIBSPDRAFT_894017 [Athelia psychrophila]|uniref:Uncharacterized protein n=1 Tax=Athelia psychrophila TaxID=1759441 RepID=A0A166GFE5_9AGAM|nr:hypothetical protein FIBSPDRAFT_894017 [Fibularhizoctonia sp. CBS 109695]